jgi:hypothetical protein
MEEMFRIMNAPAEMTGSTTLSNLADPRQPQPDLPNAQTVVGGEPKTWLGAGLISTIAFCQRRMWKRPPPDGFVQL